MNIKLKFGLLFLFLVCSNFVAFVKSKQEKTGLGNGFGDDIDWVSWPQAISTALDSDKPIFLLIHKTWCGACTALKKSFTTSSKRKDLLELSHKFVMTNTEDDDEPEEEEYSPDGRYIPRIFFLNKHGKALAVDNKKNYANNAHYFPQLPDVIKAMKLALKLYEEEQAASPDEPQDITAINKNLVEAKQEKKEGSNDDSLGEIYLSDEELNIMETGGCPHAAAARASARSYEQIEKATKSETDKKQNEEKKIKDGKKNSAKPPGVRKVEEKKGGEKKEATKKTEEKKDSAKSPAVKKADEKKKEEKKDSVKSPAVKKTGEKKEATKKTEEKKDSSKSSAAKKAGDKKEAEKKNTGKKQEKATKTNDKKNKKLKAKKEEL